MALRREQHFRFARFCHGPGRHRTFRYNLKTRLDSEQIILEEGSKSDGVKAGTGLRGVMQVVSATNNLSGICSVSE